MFDRARGVNGLTEIQKLYIIACVPLTYVRACSWGEWADSSLSDHLRVEWAMIITNGFNNDVGRADDFTHYLPYYAPSKNSEADRSSY
jgi:hypothetical protein